MATMATTAPPPRVATKALKISTANRPAFRQLAYVDFPLHTTEYAEAENSEPSSPTSSHTCEVGEELFEYLLQCSRGIRQTRRQQDDTVAPYDPRATSCSAATATDFVDCTEVRLDTDVRAGEHNFAVPMRKTGCGTRAFVRRELVSSSAMSGRAVHSPGEKIRLSTWQGFSTSSISGSTSPSRSGTCSPAARSASPLGRSLAAARKRHSQEAHTASLISIPASSDPVESLSTDLATIPVHHGSIGSISNLLSLLRMLLHPGISETDLSSDGQREQPHAMTDSEGVEETGASEAHHLRMFTNILS